MTAADAPLWLADWSDSEDADFRAAWAATGLEAEVVRSSALGGLVGTPVHRLRTWPAYAGLAVRGLARSGGRPIVAWQPLAGAAVGLLARGRGPRLIVLNPLLDPARPSHGRRLLLAGARRADRVLFFTRAGLEAGAALGLDRDRLGFLPLGVRARRQIPVTPGDYLLAAGREGRDWATLARAAEGLDAEIRVIGPASLPETRTLRLLPQVGRERFLEILEGAAALVVPLLRVDRTAGQLAVLDAMSVGRAVVATRAQGTEDYVTPETGILVPPGDPEALRAALRRMLEPGSAALLGTAALAAARGPLSLERFVVAVDAEARAA